MKQTGVIIRKYPNRRLYDTSSGRYVNLDDVAGLIRQGVDVQVLDARSGKDVTRMVLTQIIVEDTKEKPSGLPLELLRQLIMATDRAGQEFIMSNLKAAFETYRKVKDLFTASPSAPDGELEQLRQRVAELEAKAQGAAPRRRGRRK